MHKHPNQRDLLYNKELSNEPDVHQCYQRQLDGSQEAHCAGWTLGRQVDQVDAYFVGHPSLRENEGRWEKRNRADKVRHPYYGWQEGPMQHVSSLETSSSRMSGQDAFLVHI